MAILTAYYTNSLSLKWTDNLHINAYTTLCNSTLDKRRRAINWKWKILSTASRSNKIGATNDCYRNRIICQLNHCTNDCGIKFNALNRSASKRIKCNDQRWRQVIPNIQYLSWNSGVLCRNSNPGWDAKSSRSTGLKSSFFKRIISLLVLPIYEVR